MDEQKSPSLEEILLRKAQTIGAPNLPKPMMGMMPLPPTGMMGGIAKSVIGNKVIGAEEAIKHNPTLYQILFPNKAIYGNPKGLGAELGGLLMGRSLRAIKDKAVDGINHFTGKSPSQHLNSAMDKLLGYDPNLVPIGGTDDAR